jgi:hypothetical protein
MGTVYEAFDTERSRRVALKVLARDDADGIRRFKKEFRALTDVVHPNLVLLYELEASSDLWFYTMELVDGTDFEGYVSPALAAATNARAQFRDCTTKKLSHDIDENGPELCPCDPSKLPVPDFDKLRPALLQLVDAVEALHQRGYLHRDLKPSNVLVDTAGRVVVVDFGIVAALDRGGVVRDYNHWVGTPTFMAPELFENGLASPASDWYALGMMMYRVLTGQRPFQGPAHVVAQVKQALELPRPSLVAPHVPAELDELCMALIARDPAARPGAPRIREILGEGRAHEPAPASPEPDAFSTSPDILVGRAPHRAALHAALGRARDRGASVLLAGRAGAGKSALANAFTRYARIKGARVVFGRCYERERIPCQALDSLTEATAEILGHLPATKVEEYLPKDASCMVQVFPALACVPTIAEKGMDRPANEPSVSRRYALSALRELWEAMAKDRPLILVLDDLQWADADSLPLVKDLLAAPIQGVLFVGAYRVEESSSELIAELTEAGGTRPIVQIAVEPLAQGEARTLAAAVLGAELSEPVVDRVARESEGNPFLIKEYARYSAMNSDPPTSPGETVPVTLEAAIATRLGKLPREAAELLEMLSIAVAPVSLAVLRAAAAAEAVDSDRMITALRAARLIRVAGTPERNLVEIYHDRIREIVSASLDEKARCRGHLALARALEQAGSSDFDSLAVHFAASGERIAAARFSFLAAERAEEELAFERAAALYRLALEQDVPLARSIAEMLQRIGNCLVNAGHIEDATTAYEQSTLARTSSRKL